MHLLTELKRCRWSDDRLVDEDDSLRACEPPPPPPPPLLLLVLVVLPGPWAWVDWVCGCGCDEMEAVVRMVKSQPLMALSEELTRFSPGPGPGM